MAIGSRFRSIRAFKAYEESHEGVNPVQVMGLLKKYGKAMRRDRIVRRLGADPGSVDDAVLALDREGLVTIRLGDTPEEDLIEP